MPQKTASARSAAKQSTKPKSRVKVGGSSPSSRLGELFRNKAFAAYFVLLFVMIGFYTVKWSSAATTTVSLWSNSAIPKVITDSDPHSVELGVKFKTQYSGQVTGVKFYKGAQNTGTHVGNLWTASGQKLASVTFKNETATGWQTASFAQPVSISANTTYIVSYFAPKGHYSANNNYFSKTAYTSGPLTALKNSSRNGNGVYTYASASQLPTTSYKGSNYWVDVVFNYSKFFPSEKPVAPTNLTVNVTGTTATLNWQNSSTVGVTSYKIYRNGTEIGTSAAGSFVDQNLAPGTKYSYYVVAVDSAAGTTSDASNTVSVTPQTTTTPTQPTEPTSPTGGGTSTTNSYPDRWSVGAPGVAHYTQTQASLPVPAGYTEVTGNGTKGEWDIYDCSKPITYDHYYFHAFIYIGTNCSGSITIKNSIIAPPAGTTQRAILNNSNGGVNLTIQDTTIRPEPVGRGGVNAALTDHMVNNCGATCHITETRLDVSNTGGMCECGENTLVQYSWLHDSYIAHLSDPSFAHTGGVFPYGGSGPVEVSHNRLEPGFNVGTGTEVTNYWQAITAVLFTQSTGGHLQGYNVHDNFISLGAFDMDLEDGLGITVKNNVFGPSHWGATSTCSNGCTVTYADWSGNVTGDINGVRTNTVVNHP